MAKYFSGDPWYERPDNIPSTQRELLGELARQFNEQLQNEYVWWFRTAGAHHGDRGWLEFNPFEYSPPRVEADLEYKCERVPRYYVVDGRSQINVTLFNSTHLSECEGFIANYRSDLPNGHIGYLFIMDNMENVIKEYFK